VKSGPERSFTLQGTSDAAKPPLKENHSKLHHPSADDSQIFYQSLNHMSKNGKCIVNAPCDSLPVALRGAAELVKGS
jgi:hypothetical protein